MTIDERLEALTQSLELYAGMQMQVTERHDRDIAQLQARSAESQAATDARIADCNARIADSHAKLADSHAKLADSHAKTERTLRRAIRLGVQEARNQRKRHQELEALMKAFLERSGNGKH